MDESSDRGLGERSGEGFAEGSSRESSDRGRLAAFREGRSRRSRDGSQPRSPGAPGRSGEGSGAGLQVATAAATTAGTTAGATAGTKTATTSATTAATTAASQPAQRDAFAAVALAEARGASLPGRGVASQPANRFERLHYALEPEDLEQVAADAWHWEECGEAEPAEGGRAPSSQRQEGATAREPPRLKPPRTVLLRDPSRSALSRNQSPDVPFERSLNPYRGCEHGCVYCYARPGHEYLGFSAGLDFETRILVKEELPALLRKELSSPRWQPQTIALSGVTDPYQPAERRLRLTRRCLEVLAEFRNPVGIITKSAAIARDADLLGELAGFGAAAAHVSITTLRPELQRAMEPRASHPQQRLRAVRALADAGVPVGVMVAPVIPGLTDHEIPDILRAAADAGASHAGYLCVRLPYGVKALFDRWLGAHFPERRSRVLARIREMRGGALNDPRFGSRMKGEGLYAEQIGQLFELARKRAGLADERPALSTAAFRRPGEQLSLL